MMLVSIEPAVMLFGAHYSERPCIKFEVISLSLRSVGEHGARQLTCPTVCFTSKRKHLSIWVEDG